MQRRNFNVTKGFNIRQESDYTYKEPLQNTLKKNLYWTFHIHVSSLNQLDLLSKQDQDFYNEIGVIEDENLLKQGNDMEMLVFYYMVSIFLFYKKKNNLLICIIVECCWKWMQYSES